MAIRFVLSVIGLAALVSGGEFPLGRIRDVKRIYLEEVLSIGSLEDDLLYQWAGVSADEEGYVYVTDAMDYSLKKFDARGNLIKKAGRRGRGPGEFLAPRLLARAAGHLYVTDQEIFGIQVFDENLVFQQRVPINIPVSDIKIFPDGRIAVSTTSMNQVSVVSIYDEKGRILRTIPYGPKEAELMMDLVSFEFDSLENLYLVFIYQDRVEKYDRQGRQVWSIHLLNKKKVKKKKIANLVVPTEIMYKDAALDSRENLYVLGGSFSENPSRDVYVLDPEGKLQAKMTLPEASHCIHIDSQDYLYARANEGVTLKKYRMHFDQVKRDEGHERMRGDVDFSKKDRGPSLSVPLMQGGQNALSSDLASGQQPQNPSHQTRLLFVFDFADFMCPLCLESFLDFYQILPAAYKAQHSAGIVVFEEDSGLNEDTRLRIVQKKLSGFLTSNRITFPVWVDRDHVFSLISSGGTVLLLFDGQRQTIKRYAFPLNQLRTEEILSLLEHKL